LHRSDIDTLTQRLLTMHVSDISRLPGVHPLRADILPSGALILQRFLEHSGKSSCVVSAWGLRYGVLKTIRDEA
jgi:exopolyphosphatase/guanosine-5'-triphosphate,3'-diphosphate pyrophosphatase